MPYRHRRIFKGIFTVPKTPGFLGSLCLLALLAGCTSIPVEERAGVRSEIRTLGEDIKAEFVGSVPGLDNDIATAAGYFTARVSGGQATLIGGIFGRGVLVDNASGSLTYMNATRFDLGAGLAAGSYRIMVVLKNREEFDTFRAGSWKFGIGAAAAVGHTGGGIASWSEDGFRLLIAAENGAVLTASARALKVSINTDLTDTGLYNVSVPGTGFTDADERDNETPPVWTRALPFLAQKVVDEGYELPLPYGVSFVYARVDQDQLISDLEVGINGRDKELFEFVSFGQSLSTADSANLMFDAWLFPFMNVYATLGKIDGDADIQILIDGSGMLDHMGISCGGVIQNPLCPRLQGQDFLLPIPTDFSGTTYGVGATLAGGWQNWFVAIPFNYSDIDLDDASADGGPIFTISPRFGYVFNVGRHGNLALFTGGNYLHAELQLSGTYLIGVEDQQLSFDYTVQQENKDRWNAVVGMNWDISKRIALSMEYNGFAGSREAFITSATWSF